MSKLGFHIRTRLKDGRVIARNAQERRKVAQVVIEQGKAAGLFCFSMPDQHLHMGTGRSEREAGRFCRRVELSLSRRLGLDVGFEMYPPIPIVDQHHLEQLVRYILTQHQRHRVRVDPFRESTSLPDLLGMRAIGGEYTQHNLYRLLTRLSRETLLEWLAPGLTELSPVDPPLNMLVELTCRAAALQDLAGSRSPVVAARRAAIEAVGSGVTGIQLAPVLGVSPRSVQWLRHRPADPMLVRAIRLQMGAQTYIGGLRSAA